MTPVQDAQLDVSASGSGSERAVLHGMLSSRANEALDSTTISVPGRVIAYDARGHSRSTGRAELGDYLWTRLADDLCAVLDEHMTGPVDAIGASMGTATVLHAALAAPERFRRVVLTLAPTAWVTRAAQVDAYRSMADVVSSQGLDALAPHLAAMPVPPALAEVGSLSPPDVAEGLLPAVLRGAADSDLPAPEALRALRHPVLLVPWTDDPGHPMSTSEQLPDLLPDARMHVVASPSDLAGRSAVIAEFLA